MAVGDAAPLIAVTLPPESGSSSALCSVADSDWQLLCRNLEKTCLEMVAARGTEARAVPLSYSPSLFVWAKVCLGMPKPEIGGGGLPQII